MRPGSRNLREARQTTSIESLRSVPSLVGLPAAFAGSVIVLFRRASSPRSPVQVPLSSPRSNPLASGQTPSTGPLPAGSEIRRTALVRRTRFAALTPTARFPHHPSSDPMRHPSARESGCCDRRWRSAFGGIALPVEKGRNGLTPSTLSGRSSCAVRGAPRSARSVRARRRSQGHCASRAGTAKRRHR